jgi:hypothetical protein
MKINLDWFWENSLKNGNQFDGIFYSVSNQDLNYTEKNRIIREARKQGYKTKSCHELLIIY